LAKSLAGTSSETDPNQPLHAADQRQSETVHQTLLAEWAYVIAYQTFEERNCWQPRYLGVYNGQKCHMAFGGLSPQQSLQWLLIAE